jgi:hypothetical protein
MPFANVFFLIHKMDIKTERVVVMYRAWLGLKARAWAWLWWAWAFKILSQARIEGLPKPGAWLGLKPGLVYHIWILLQKASKCVEEQHWNDKKDWRLKK